MADPMTVVKLMNAFAPSLRAAKLANKQRKLLKEGKRLHPEKQREVLNKALGLKLKQGEQVDPNQIVSAMFKNLRDSEVLGAEGGPVAEAAENIVREVSTGGFSGLSDSTIDVAAKIATDALGPGAPAVDVIETLKLARNYAPMVLGDDEDLLDAAEESLESISEVNKEAI